jgi:hypothetical protein
MKGEAPHIDIVAFYAQSNSETWNQFLRACLLKQDVAKLVDVSRRMQQGMAIAAKQGLNTDEICEWFIRIQRSMENTLKQIYRAKNKNPLYSSHNKEHRDKWLKDKRQGELDFERFLKKTRY